MLIPAQKRRKNTPWSHKNDLFQRFLGLKTAENPWFCDFPPKNDKENKKIEENVFFPTIPSYERLVKAINS